MYPQRWGGRPPESVFEEVGYFDTLLEDLRRVNWRKKGWWREMMSRVEWEIIGGWWGREWHQQKGEEEVRGWLMVCSELMYRCCS